MIITELYNGQGLGNQLWCYVVTRCIAKEKKINYGIMSQNKFKAKSFLEIDFGLQITGGKGPEGGPPIVLPNGINKYYKEKMTRHPSNGHDISKKDINLYKIDDNTKIDGIMQSIDYIKNYREDIKKWISLKTQNKNTLSKNECIIHIRGGDFLGSIAFLEKKYYENAIQYMKNKNSNMVFYIITDDINYSKFLFPNIKIIGGSSYGIPDPEKANHHIGGPIEDDWKILLNCKNAIISASSFAWWPIWLNDDVNVIAPKYWAAQKYSNGYWSCGDSLIEKWNYLDRDGKLFSYDECFNEKQIYEEKNNLLWVINE